MAKFTDETGEYQKLGEGTTFRTKGYYNLTIEADGDSDNFYLKRPVFQWGWKHTLEKRGTGTEPQAVVEIIKKCGLFRPPVRLSSPEGDTLAELVGTKRCCGLQREFTYAGRTYRWKKESSCFAWTLRFVLVEVLPGEVKGEKPKTGDVIAQCKFGHCGFKGTKGTILILPGGGQLPKELVVAMALAMEGLWRDQCWTSSFAAHGGAT